MRNNIKTVFISDRDPGHILQAALDKWDTMIFFDIRIIGRAKTPSIRKNYLARTCMSEKARRWASMQCKNFITAYDRSIYV